MTEIESELKKLDLAVPDLTIMIPAGATAKYTVADRTVVATEVPFDAKGTTDEAARRNLASFVADLIHKKPEGMACVMLVRADITVTKVGEGRYYASANLGIAYVPKEMVEANTAIVDLEWTLEIEKRIQITIENWVGAQDIVITDNQRDILAKLLVEAIIGDEEMIERLHQLVRSAYRAGRVEGLREPVCDS